MKLPILLDYIWRLGRPLVTVVLIGACAGSDAAYDTIEEAGVLPKRNITFSTGAVSRATQITNMREENFGVKAFILSNVWASAGYNAKPDAAWNGIKISCDDVGICTYTPIKKWEDGKYYTFFGFYPFNDPSVTVSDASHESTPFIVYSPSPDDPTLHRDVMVASRPDCTAINTGQVRLQFSHILFCVNVAVNNYNDEVVQLDNVVCRFTSSLYSRYQINMDKSAPVPEGSMTNASYLMTNSVNVKNTATIGAMNITDSDKFLMLIPQEGLIGKICFNITRGGQTDYKEIDFEEPETLFRAGYRYTFILYFVGEAIHLRIMQNNEWADNNNSIEFD